MANENYDIVPLDTSGPTFRLLKVHSPTPKDREIRCSLRHHRIDATSYRAVSYVWDPESEVVLDQGTGMKALPLRYRIYINGKPHIVRQNLFRFLRMAQRFYPDSNLWVDYLCINQFDVKELNHQVGQMETIYTHAAEVLSWLGPGDKDTDAFLDFANECSEERVGRNPFKHMIDQGLFRRPHRVCKSACAVCDLFPSIDTGFRKILKNEYWTRMWIVQEVILAKELIIVCGTRRTRLSAITNPLSEQPLWEGCIEFSIGAKEMASLTAYKRDWWPGELPLCELIQKFRRQKCLNPHDRLYALLGLTLETETITVNYKRSTAELVEYAFSRINWSNYLYAPMVAEAIGVSLPNATEQLPANVLDRKFSVREETPYTTIEAGKHAGEAIISTPAGSKLFWRVYDRTKLIPCQRFFCRVFPITYPPREGDVVLKLPRMELQTIFRPTPRTKNDGLAPGSQQLRFLCPICPDPQLWRNNQVLSYCPVDDTLQKLLEKLRPTVVSWGPNQTALIDWTLDWRVIFAISRYTNFERIVTTEVLTGPPTEPRWLHGDRQSLRSVERTHDGYLAESVASGQSSVPSASPATSGTANTSVTSSRSSPSLLLTKPTRREMRSLLAEGSTWDIMGDAPRRPRQAPK